MMLLLLVLLVILLLPLSDDPVSFLHLVAGRYIRHLKKTEPMHRMLLVETRAISGHRVVLLGDVPDSVLH